MSGAGVPDVLAKIVAAEVDVVADAKRRNPLAALRATELYAAPRRSLVDSLAARVPGVIAECKRRSPSKGVLRDPYDPVAIAKGYEAAGASGISVLTNEEFFGGTLAELAAVRAAVDVPLLRKDFVIDEFQLEEARAFGADAALLIVSVLEPAQLVDLTQAATGLGLDVLVEIHSREELEPALLCGAQLVGINNRNLHNFVTDLATTEQLAPLVPEDRTVVAESGLRDGADLRRLAASGAGCFLVGEAFMKSDVPGDALRAMIEEFQAGEGH